MISVNHKKLFISTLRPKNIFCLFLLCICSNTLHAQQLSPAEAAASARNFTDGKILKVKPTQGEKINYRVKVLSPEGRVRNIIVDGDNGEIILHKRKAKRKKKIHERQQLLKTGY
jgi:hypothetical protein